MPLLVSINTIERLYSHEASATHGELVHNYLYLINISTHEYEHSIGMLQNFIINYTLLYLLIIHPHITSIYTHKFMSNLLGMQ